MEYPKSVTEIQPSAEGRLLILAMSRLLAMKKYASMSPQDLLEMLVAGANVIFSKETCEDCPQIDDCHLRCGDQEHPRES